MIYEYYCSIHDTFEVQQSIKDPPLSICPKCEEEKIENPPTPKRLISASTTFILKDGCWAKDLYNK